MPDDWQSLLLVSKRKDGSERTLPIAANAITILTHHDAWKGVLAFDAFRETTITTREPPWHEVDAPKSVAAASGQTSTRCELRVGWRVNSLLTFRLVQSRQRYP